MTAGAAAARLRVGIIGAGFIGGVHAAAWSRLGAGRLLVHDSSPDAMRGAAMAGAEPATSLEELFEAVDVVDICTPTDLHRPLTEAAATAGCHVICEKPIALSLANAEAMIEACRAAGVHLLIGHVVRYFPEYAAAQAAVAAGRIGRPAVIRLRRESFRPARPKGHWLFDEERSGGVVLDLMIHDLDVARWIGGPVESVMARRVRDASGREVDHAVALLRHASGAISHITAGWSYPPPTFRTGFEIAGDGGLIEYESTDRQPLVTYVAPDGAAGDAVGLPASPLEEDPFMAELGDFAAAIAGERAPRVTAEEAVEALRLGLAAIVSSRTGGPAAPAAIAR